jgi:hypothetical protein
MGEFMNKLWTDSEKFATLLEQMPDSKLDEVFVDEKYGTYRRNIDGMIEHVIIIWGRLL